MELEDGADAGVLEDVGELVVATISRKVGEKERVLSIFAISTTTTTTTTDADRRVTRASTRRLRGRTWTVAAKRPNRNRASFMQRAVKCIAHLLGLIFGCERDEPETTRLAGLSITGDRDILDARSGGLEHPPQIDFADGLGQARNEKLASIWIGHVSRRGGLKAGIDELRQRLARFRRNDSHRADAVKRQFLKREFLAHRPIGLRRVPDAAPAPRNTCRLSRASRFSNLSFCTSNPDRTLHVSLCASNLPFFSPFWLLSKTFSETRQRARSPKLQVRLNASYHLGMRVTVIANPRAGAGNAARRLSALRQGLESQGIEHEVLETLRTGHASELARAARARGTELFAVLGGDGTLNEVAQAYIDADGSPIAGPPITLVPAGTGGDFARACGVSEVSNREIIELLAAPAPRAIDLGVISLADANGKTVHRAFVNVTSVGISGEVDERVERGPKWLGGKAAFMLGTVGAALSYQNVPMEIEVDGQNWHRGPVLLAAIANGRYMGGGMHIAPNADFADGLLDVVCVGDLTRTRFLTLFPKVYQGTHLALDVVRSVRARSVALRTLGARKPVLVDVDGETPGYLPLSARIFPGALSLATG